MRFQSFPLTGALFLSLALISDGQAQVTEQNARALTTMQSVNIIGSFVRDWCFARAPQARTAVTAGFNGWRQDTKLDVFEKTLTGMSPEAIKSLQTSLESGRAKMYAELDKAAKNPAQECLGIRSYLNAQLNPQKMYPEAYAAALKVQAAPVQAAPTPSAPQTNSPASAGEVTRGGPLTAGTYNCSMPISAEYGTSRFSISLYANGEYRETVNGKETDTSAYKYDPKTGKIDISVSRKLYNSITGDDEFSIFFKDAKGNPYIYAEDDYGLGVSKVTCVYAGANKYPAPSQVKAQQAKAEAAKEAEREKERNRYRTAPNAGLKLGQIKTLIHSYKSQSDGLNIKVQEDVTLLLNDGSAYLNLQYTPHDLNANASKAGEPKNWTRWRASGGGYQILENGKWVKLDGHEVKPFRQNERLSGAYSYKSAYQIGYGDNASVSYSESNYYFNPKGTFDRGGMARTTGGTDMGGIKTSGVAQTSDAGTTGTYSLSGYTLQLKYKDGTILRPFAFFWGDDRKRLVIGGTTYSR